MTRRNEQVVLKIEDSPSQEDRDYLHQQIKIFNDTVSEHHREARKTGSQPLGIFMRDPAGRLLGGLVGFTYWDWLDIDHLWLPEELRAQGHGAQIVKTAERRAIERGCKHAQVKTWDFQALGFYQKLGYQVIGQLADYPPGHTFYWLRKDFR